MDIINSFSVQLSHLGCQSLQTNRCEGGLLSPHCCCWSCCCWQAGPVIPLSCCYLCLPCLSNTKQRHRCIAENKALVKEIADNQIPLAVKQLCLTCMHLCVCAVQRIAKRCRAGFIFSSLSHDSFIMISFT